jgi:3'-5' exoribonuclease
MSKVFVEELKNGQGVDSVFLVRDKALAVTKDGRPYIRVALIDRTGKIEARMWDRQTGERGIERTFESFRQNDFVRVTGRVESFKDSLQVNVETIVPTAAQDIDVADFVPKGDKNPEEIVRDLTRIVASLKNPFLKRLGNAFLRDGRFMERFTRAPAAKKLHQAYLGGLLEHTHNIVKMALDVAQHYPQINSGILVIGALLHDIGKIEELEYERAFDYSDRGRFLGHLFIGARMVDEKIATIESFPEDLKNMVLHLILSHHGQHEYGAPVLPVTLEAVVLFQLDDLDAKVWGFTGEQVRSEALPGNWTAFSNVYSRFIYKGDTYIGMDEDEAEKRERKKRERMDKKLMLGLFDDQ